MQESGDLEVMPD